MFSDKAHDVPSALQETRLSHAKFTLDMSPSNITQLKMLCPTGLSILWITDNLMTNQKLVELQENVVNAKIEDQNRDWILVITLGRNNQSLPAVIQHCYCLEQHDEGFEEKLNTKIKGKYKCVLFMYHTYYQLDLLYVSRSV